MIQLQLLIVSVSMVNASKASQHVKNVIRDFKEFFAIFLIQSRNERK